MILVLDTSSLIVLARIGSLELLRRLADRIVIPDAVYEESVRQGQGKPGSAEIAHADWIGRQPALDQSSVTRLRRTLGQGEAEAIVLARRISSSGTICTPRSCGKLVNSVPDMFNLRDEV